MDNYYSQNREKILERARARYQQNKTQKKQYYEANKEKILSRLNARKQSDPDAERERKRQQRVRRRKAIKAFLLQFKSTHPCKRCGETNPVVLHFHHRDPSVKKINLSSVRASITAAKEEIEKCDVLCANCHLITHDASRKKKPLPPEQ